MASIFSEAVYHSINEHGVRIGNFADRNPELKVTPSEPHSFPNNVYFHVENLTLLIFEDKVRKDLGLKPMGRARARSVC